MDGLKELYQYQEITNRIRILGEQKAALAADTAISEVTSRLSRLALRLASVQGAISDLKKEMSRLEVVNGGEIDKRKQCEKKLYDGSTTSPKELAQLQQKIVEYQEVIDVNDEKALQLMEQLEKNEQDLVKLRKEEKRRQAELNQLKQKSEDESGSFDQQIARLEREAEALKKWVPAELMELYNRKNRAQRGKVIAPLEEDLCGACHVALSPGILHNLRKSKEGFIQCENCGRMIFILES